MFFFVVLAARLVRASLFLVWWCFLCCFLGCLGFLVFCGVGFVVWVVGLVLVFWVWFCWVLWLVFVVVVGCWVLGLLVGWFVAVVWCWLGCCFWRCGAGSSPAFLVPASFRLLLGCWGVPGVLAPSAGVGFVFRLLRCLGFVPRVLCGLSVLPLFAAVLVLCCFGGCLFVVRRLSAAITPQHRHFNYKKEEIQ